MPWPRISRSALARVMLPRTARDAIPAVRRVGVVCGGVWLELARRSGWRRWLRRVSGGARARSIVRHQRRLRRRFAHHELLRARTDLRFAGNRADALHGARGAVRPDLSGMWVRRAAAARRRWLTCAIPSHRGCHLPPGQVHDLRPRVRSAVRDGNDLFQLHEPRQRVRGLHHDLHWQHRLPRRHASAVSKRLDRQHVRDVLHGSERRVRHAVVIGSDCRRSIARINSPIRNDEDDNGEDAVRFDGNPVAGRCFIVWIESLERRRRSWRGRERGNDRRWGTGRHERRRPRRWWCRSDGKRRGRRSCGTWWRRGHDGRPRR